MSTIDHFQAKSSMAHLPLGATSVSLFQWSRKAQFSQISATKKMALMLLETNSSLQTVFAGCKLLISRQEIEKSKKSVTALHSPFLQLPNELHARLIECLDRKTLFRLLTTHREFHAQVLEQLTPRWCLVQSIFSTAHITNLTENVRSPRTISIYQIQNRFHTFCYVPALQAVITGDAAEYHRLTHPLNVWSLAGKNIQRIKDSSFFYKPIQFISLNPLNNQFAVGSRECIQIWKVDEGKLCLVRQLKTGNYEKALTALYYSHDLLCYANQRGEVFIQRTEGASSHKWTRIAFAEDEWHTISWIDVDPIKQHLFVKTRSTISVYSILTNEQLYSIAHVQESAKPQLDCNRELLIFDQDKKTIIFTKTTTGEQLHQFILPDADHTITAFHFDSISQQLFVGIDTNDVTNKTKIIVWETVEKVITRSFFTKYDKTTAYPLEKLDYDHESELLLTAGYGVQLWDMHTKLRVNDFTKGSILKVHWDKAHRKLLILPQNYSQNSSSTITLIDYGRHLAHHTF